jgi:hypothetical protein
LIPARTRAEKAQRTRRRNGRPLLALPRPHQVKRERKPRFVDGHEAVILTAEQEGEQRTRLALGRAKGTCECGCGLSLLCAGAERHHWKGRTRGNRCDCDAHIQILTSACHRIAQSKRLGAPYRSKA